MSSSCEDGRDEDLEETAATEALRAMAWESGKNEGKEPQPARASGSRRGPGTRRRRSATKLTGREYLESEDSEGTATEPLIRTNTARQTEERVTIVDKLGGWTRVALIAAMSTLLMLIVRSFLYGGASAMRASEGTRHSRSRLHLFTAPKPFVGLDEANQVRALMSWTALRPRPQITFLGDGEGYEGMARRFNARIDRRIDTSFRGMPLFSSMINRANSSTASVAVLINSDILLFDDFAMILDKLSRDFGNFLAIGARWDVEKFPNITASSFDALRYYLVNEVRTNGQLHTYGGIDVWAWNTNGSPLFDGSMPHFIYGRGKYDNWLTHEAIAAGHRAVVDISEAATLVHVNHDYHLVAGADGLDEKTGLRRSFWNSGIHSKFELYINNYLANTHGTYQNQMGTILHAPFKMTSCYEPIPFCTFKRRRPHECRCEYSPFVPSAQSDPFTVSDSRVIFCGQAPVERENDLQFRLLTGRGGSIHSVFGFPLQLEPLLDLLVENKTIVITTLNYNSRDLLENFVCNLRRLRITNFIIAALDDQLYQYGVVRGLPIYLEDTIFSSDEEMQRVEAANHALKDVYLLTQTRLKTVQRVLSMGYDVVYSDVDVLWLRNPIPTLRESMAPVQVLSAAAKDAAPNSAMSCAFSFFRANSSAEDLLKTAADLMDGSTSTDTEALYSAACGTEGQFQRGGDRCSGSRGGDMVYFMPTKLFVDGVAQPHMWNRKNFIRDALDKGAIVLHNSGVVSNSDKIRRLTQRKALFVDQASGLCIYPKTLQEAYRLRT